MTTTELDFSLPKETIRYISNPKLIFTILNKEILKIYNNF